MFSTFLGCSFAILASTVLFGSVIADTNGFTYTSCQSAYDFQYVSPLFVQVDTSDSMTVELCTSECAFEYAFAALHGSECFCGQTFTAFAPPGQDIECNTPCPGNAAEICGGYHNVSRGSEWWSLYSKFSPSSSSSSTSIPTSTPISISSSITASPIPTSTKTILLSLNSNYTSTAYKTTTTTSTITSCPPGIENCPGKSTASIVPTSRPGNYSVSAGVKSTSIVGGGSTATRSIVGTGSPSVVPVTGVATVKKMGVEGFGLLVLGGWLLALF